MNRKRFILFLIQFPIFSTVFSFFGVIQPKKHYFLNEFSIAGFQFHNGIELINKMKKGEKLSLILDPQNNHDNFAVKIIYKNNMIGYVPRSDNKHIFRMLNQGLDLHCEIIKLNPNEDPWQMCKVKVDLIG